MVQRIGVLTSGGDAPGMNAAVRAVVRTGIFHGLDVYGISNGYYGLYHDEIELAIDRLRDTSSSHKRLSVVEIMGRHCGDLTVAAAVCSGAEFAVIPEVEYSEEKLLADLCRHVETGKKHGVICVTEKICDVYDIARKTEEATGLETRATVLGHIQRGGAPNAFDRMLASRMGAYAVKLLMQGEAGKCIGIQANKLTYHDIIDALENMVRPYNPHLLELCYKLS